MILSGIPLSIRKIVVGVRPFLSHHRSGFHSPPPLAFQPPFLQEAGKESRALDPFRQVTLHDRDSKQEAPVTASLGLCQSRDLDPQKGWCPVGFPASQPTKVPSEQLQTLAQRSDWPDLGASSLPASTRSKLSLELRKASLTGLPTRDLGRRASGSYWQQTSSPVSNP